jgi:hypothetical protein
MTKAVAVKADTLNEQALDIHRSAAAMATQMAETGIEVGDLEIPKLMLMQNTSELVGAEEASFGDMINTMSNEKLGDFSQPVEIVPLKLFKTLRIYDISGKQPKFLRAEPLDPVNEALPWEGNEGGIAIKRVKNMNFFILLKSEIEAGTAFPLVVSFKSTGMQAGKQLATQLFRMVALGQLPYSQSVTLMANKEKKETNTYAVFKIGKSTKLDPAAVHVAKEWLGRLASLNYKVHETADEDRDDAGAVPAPTVVKSQVVGEKADDIY